MFSTAVDIALIVAIAAVTVAVIALIGFKLARSSRDLGSEAELATYTTLHTAGLAAPFLRPLLFQTSPREPVYT